MMIGRRRNNAPSRRTLQETDLQQIRLVYILNGLALFTYRSSDGIQPDRTAPEGADHGLQHLMVNAVQSPGSTWSIFSDSAAISGVIIPSPRT